MGININEIAPVPFTEEMGIILVCAILILWIYYQIKKIEITVTIR